MEPGGDTFIKVSITDVRVTSRHQFIVTVTDLLITFIINVSVALDDDVQFIKLIKLRVHHQRVLLPTRHLARQLL